MVDRGRPGRDPAPGVARATSCLRAFLLLVVATEVSLRRNESRSGGYASGSVADVEEGVDIDLGSISQRIARFSDHLVLRSSQSSYLESVLL